MANRLFQTVIHQMQPALMDRKAGIIDENGAVIACTDVNDIGSVRELASSRAKEIGDAIVVEGDTYRRIGIRNRSEYVIFCSGNDDFARSMVGVLSISFSQIKQFYDEKYDKNSLVKNILEDNIMPGEIHIKSRAMHLNLESNCIVFLIRVSGDEFSAHEVVSGMFPDKNKDFVISMNENDIVLIKTIGENETPADFEKIASTIVHTLNTELMANASVGIGSVVTNIIEINRSYKDACVAIDVGKVFDPDLPIISYNNLGIGRLIYQLPTKLCELFLNEVFKKGSLNILDEETVTTIQKFFDNNLNVSEASRKLFVHRNTLVYRLDKLYKLTGLDIRKFDDAIVFKVAMMVNRYLNSDSLNL
ncbi:MAG: helix-turn-helix domain-containing protein [Clostridia bacterium]|nr:helix-turn-helix domain-containing protein [Clostridia bacterium]